MKFLKSFEPFFVNEGALPARTAKGSTSPIVLYAYSANQNDEQLFKKLMWGGDNELSSEIKRIPEASFKVTRTCVDDNKANYSLELKNGQATAGEGQARLNPATYHSDPAKKFSYKVESIQPEVDGKKLAGIWLIDIMASQPLAAEGTILNTGKVLSQFKNAGKVNGRFVAAKGNSVVFQARSAIMHVVYAPDATTEVVSPKDYDFKNAFKYNSTQVELSSPENQQKLTALLKDLKSGFKFQVNAQGNASKVPTQYKGGNEALAKDRASALVQAVQQSAVKAGIKWEAVVTATNVTSAVSGPEWKQGASEDAYAPYQFVKVQLVPEKGQQKTV